MGRMARAPARLGGTVISVNLTPFLARAITRATVATVAQA